MMQTASCGTAGRKRMYRLGFDIGGTHIACGIINDETFEIVGKDACAFFRGQSAEKTAQCMAELAKTLPHGAERIFNRLKPSASAYREHRCAERNGC